MGKHRTVILFGDARQMTERIRQLEAVGMNHLMILANFGALEPEQLRASLERFAHEVMPHFADRELISAS